jgi:hypothetical protein
MIWRIGHNVHRSTTIKLGEITVVTRIFALLCLFAASSVTWAQTPIDGDWNFTMSSPMGSVTAKVTMMVAGDALTGQFDLGGGRTWPIEEGKVDGNNISFKINRDGASMTYAMSAQVTGDEFSGVAAAMGSTVDWSMKRAQ